MHDRLTYSVEQAAALLGVSRGKAYECIRTGELKAVRVGRRLVVPAHALDGLLGLGEQATSSSDVVNQVEVVGRLTRRPDDRPTRTGSRMATLRLAVGGRDAEHPIFIDVVAFGELVDDVLVLTKGQQVCVAGRLDQREWTTEDGYHRSTHQIVARRIEALEPPRRQSAAS
ncbi:MAG: single-stranded DNA-binding protein [Actinomycetota bacterium]